MKKSKLPSRQQLVRIQKSVLFDPREVPHSLWVGAANQDYLERSAKMEIDKVHLLQLSPSETAEAYTKAIQFLLIALARTNESIQDARARAGSSGSPGSSNDVT
jgi:hypothetical protein